MLFFDLDGVLRSLTHTIGFDPQSWNEEYNGKSLVQYYDENLNLLEDAEPTKYLKLLPNKVINIITFQPEKWIPHTQKWIDKYIKQVTKVTYVKSAKEKLDCLSDRDTLIEDYPFFDNYNQIVLIDQPYNKNVKTVKRISNEVEFTNFIEEYYG
jgi:hypothetical protein